MSKKSFLLILSTFLGIFLFANSVLAKTNTADLGVSASSSYTYDNTKIEFSGGVARLKADSTWLNSSWGYREALTITNPTASSSINPALKINITSSSANFWNRIESDGRSLRFTSSDGQTLTNYYVDSFDYTGQTTTIYVKVPSLSAGATTTLYMYYGNTGATSLTSATDTLSFDETFTGGSIDTNKYTIIDANNVFSQNGTQLVGAAFEGGSSWHSLYASTTLYTVSPSYGLIFEADFSTVNTANKDQNLRIGLKNNSVETVSTFFSSLKYDVYINGGYSAGCSNYSIRFNSDGTNTTDSGYDIACDTTYRIRIEVYPSDGADYFISGGAFTNWTYLGHSTFNYSDPMVLGIIKHEAQATIDNIRIRRAPVSRGFTRNASSPLTSAINFSEPSVMYENGMFKMWYSTTSSPFVVGYATSSDGINWSSGSVVLSASGVNGTFDKSVASRPEVIKDGGVYYLYYNGFETDQSGTGKIGLATSTDGITWTRYTNNPILSPGASSWENNSLYNTAVVKVGSTWYMLFEGRGVTTNRLGLATSTDGITWTRYANNPVITNGLLGAADNYAAAPNLIYQDGKFYTWYLFTLGDGKYRLARAYSTDAINWTKFASAELSPEQAWEYISVSDASNPIEVNGSVYMYYMGGNQAGIGNMALLNYSGTLSSVVSPLGPSREFSGSSVATSTQYTASSPSLVGPGVAYDKITAFNTTSTGNGSIAYQISNNGSNWYYWNGTTWASASNSSQANSSTVINTNITAFSDAHPSGTFYWKAFFVSDGTQTSSLSNLSFVTNILPTITIDTISGHKTTSVTVNYRIIDPDQDTVNFSQTATSGIEYSLNGSTWQDATASTTGDGLTGLSSTSSPGQAHTFVWDSLTDASTTESNTVYLRFRPNDGLDFGASWTTSSLFGVDNVAPSGVGAPTFGTIASTSIEVVKPSVVTESGSGLNQWQVRRDGTTTESAISTSTNSLTVNNLTPNTLYSFDVRFTDMVTNTSAFGTSTTQYTNAALPVSPVISSISTSSVVVSWDANNNPTSTVYRINGDNGFTSVTTTATSTTLTGLISNKNYTFNVQSQNSGDSSYNSAVTASATTTLPQIPSNPTISALSTSTLTLSWGENNNSTTTVYQISATGFTSVTTTATTSAITGLTPNTSYTFTVKAYYASDNTTLTSGSSATATNTTPQVPTSVTVSSISTSSVVVSWGANSNNSLTVYEISEPDVVPSFTTVTSTGTSTSITGLTPNTLYTFNVKARNYSIPSSLTSAATASATGTLSALPISPTVSSLSISTLSLSWGANNNPTGTVYEISATGFTSVNTTATTLAITGLTPNTSYTFTVKAKNPDTSYNAGTTALVTTTLANVPSSIAVSADSHSQITISWSGDATNYYVENTTAGTNSDWQSSAQKTFSNLSCGTMYVFRVKGRNSEQIITDWSPEASVRTFGCGSFVPAAPPSVPVSASAGALSTQQTVVDSRSVILSVSAQNAKQMAISNYPSFVGVSWEPYNSTKKWNLLPGSGQKTVYVKFRSAGGGVSDTYKFNFILNEQNSKPVQNTVVSQKSVIQEIVKNNLNLKIKNPDQYKAGALLQLAYQYTNDTKNTVKIKVTRELLDSKNKVIKLSNGRATLKPGKSFANNIKEKLPTNLKVGNYSVRIRIYNQQTGKLIVQDLQSLKISKKK